jgi:hypothetical protein
MHISITFAVSLIFLVMTVSESKEFEFPLEWLCEIMMPLALDQIDTVIKVFDN